MGEFSLTHLLLVAVILLVFFGPSRLPGLGQAIGKSIRGFKDGLSGNSEAEQKKQQELKNGDAAQKSEDRKA